MLKFKQSNWMKKYIDFNTEKRRNETYDFERDFFKLMVNSGYGKTMENLRKRINVRLVTDEKDFLKYTSRPTCITHKIFDKDFAAIHEIKPVLILNKVIYVGFTGHFVNQHPTSQQTSHIPHPEHSTFRTSHIPNIPHPQHLTSPASHIPNIPYPQHSTSPTSHIPNISHPEHPTS